MIMFVIPHAGGSIISYDFLKIIPNVKIHFLRLNFDRSEHIEEYSILIEYFMKEIDSAWDYSETAIFLGVSFGGQIAYDLVRYYECNSVRSIIKLVIVSAVFETKLSRIISIAKGNSKRLQSFLSDIGVSTDFLRNPWAKNSIIKDFSLLVSRPLQAQQKLQTRILLICGRKDKEVCRQINQWKKSSVQCTVSMYHGGHLFFLSNPNLICNEILTIIESTKKEYAL